MIGARRDIVLPGAADIIEQHQAMIRRFGGSPAVRDAGLPESAVARVGKTPARDADMDKLEAAALLCCALAGNRPSVDGSKRAGYDALVAMLAPNGLRFDQGVDHEEVSARIIEIAAGGRDFAAFRDRREPRLIEDGACRPLAVHDSGHGGGGRDERVPLSLPAPGGSDGCPATRNCRVRKKVSRSWTGTDEARDRIDPVTRRRS